MKKITQKNVVKLLNYIQKGHSKRDLAKGLRKKGYTGHQVKEMFKLANELDKMQEFHKLRRERVQEGFSENTLQKLEERYLGITEEKPAAKKKEEVDWVFYLIVGVGIIVGLSIIALIVTDQPVPSKDSDDYVKEGLWCGNFSNDLLQYGLDASLINGGWNLISKESRQAVDDRYDDLGSLYRNTESSVIEVHAVKYNKAVDAKIDFSSFKDLVQDKTGLEACDDAYFTHRKSYGDDIFTLTANRNAITVTVTFIPSGDTYYSTEEGEEFIKDVFEGVIG